MRTPLNRFERASAWFFVAVLACAVAAVLLSRRRDLSELFAREFVVFVVAGDAGGTAAGSPVRVHDVEVGSVTRVELVDDPRFPGHPVKFTLGIEPSAVRFLHADTAVFVQQGVPGIGGGAICLESRGAGELRRESTIVGVPAPSLLSLLGEDGAKLREEAQRVLSSVDAMIKNLRVLTDALIDGEGMAVKLLNDEQMAAELQSVPYEVKGTTADARKLMVSSQRLTDGAPETLHEATAAVKEGRELMADAKVAMAALPQLLAALQRVIDNTEELVASLQSSAHYAPELVRKADTSMQEAQRLVEAALQNFLIRGSLPARQERRTNAVTRPPVVVPSAAP